MKTRVCLSCEKSFVLGNNCRRIYCSRDCIPREIFRKNMAKAREVSRTHGESFVRTPEYDAWRNMKQRCSSKKKSEYYSGRGIVVCDRWIRSFPSFLEDVGRRPGPEYSIDRIDNDRGYEPGNVRWATWTVQMNNRRHPSLWPHSKRKVAAQ